MKQKTGHGNFLTHTGKNIARFFIYFIPGLFAVSCIFPVIWLAYTSFKSKTEYTVDVLGLPSRFYQDNWKYVLHNLKLVN